uniref:Uncharacterized protein n=1 Tax=Lactuca sativa TaxID=4236 RepID=A0A9R1XGS8_LACSA|nr:hypothetical protein LSAT_V11C400220210 [Lactuca sativa]
MLNSSNYLLRLIYGLITLKKSHLIIFSNIHFSFCLTIVILNVQNDLDNITRYLILAREPIIPGIDKPHKTSIVFTLEEGPRVLFNALVVFALREINLSKVYYFFHPFI